MSSIQEYWDAMPPVTRGYLAGSLVMTSLVSFGMVNPMKVLFVSTAVIRKFEIWRILTNYFFFGKFSFNFLMQMLILGRFGSQIEQDPFRTPNGGTADFVYSLILMGSGLLGLGYLLDLVMLGPSLIFALVYLWSRKNAHAPVAVWGFRFTGSSLPWVLLAFTVLTGGSPVPDLCGLAVGHLYYFLVEVLPLKYGRPFVTTPGIVSMITEQFIGGNAPSAPQPTFGTGQRRPQQPAAARPARHNWGTGRRLGD